MQLSFHDEYPTLYLYGMEKLETNNGRDDDINEWVNEPEQKSLGLVKLGHRIYATPNGEYVYSQKGYQTLGSFHTSMIFRFKLEPEQIEVMKKVLAGIINVSPR